MIAKQGVGRLNNSITITLHWPLCPAAGEPRGAARGGGALPAQRGGQPAGQPGVRGGQARQHRGSLL